MMSIDFEKLALIIKTQGKSLGFDEVGIAGIDLTKASKKLKTWLSLNYHGEMDYMSKHGSKRFTPDELANNTLTVISVRLNYWLNDDPLKQLDHPENAYISRYALGRDYHKTIKNKLKKLSAVIQEQIGDYEYRLFCDSAPVLEKPLAEKAGLGWIGKNTNLINKKDGSYFFLGEIYTNLPLPLDQEHSKEHCGSCKACIDICPTKAIVAPFILDARRCISYHTIELKGSIPVEFRKPIGNRIYGCDDCQLICPWNKFAKTTSQIDFLPRNNLNELNLSQAFSWDERTFQEKTEGSAIRRIGHHRWLRNLAVALGNSPSKPILVKTLKKRLNHRSELVKEHVRWALNQHRQRQH